MKTFNKWDEQTFSEKFRENADSEYEKIKNKEQKEKEPSNARRA